VDREEKAETTTRTPAKKKLSYMEAREYATIEQRIAEAEATLQSKSAAAEDPAIASDAEALLKAHADLGAAQNAVDELFSRWAELEEKQKN
jgi:ATP-binding cassette subfamily F protein uup